MIKLKIVLIFMFCLFFVSNLYALSNVYYSISPFGTGDIKSGSPTLTMSSGTATFTVAQTGNIGVGCRVTYDTTSIAYISAVNSSTSFDLVTAIGADPGDEGSSVTVNSIAHEYISLSDAEAGFTDADHINNTSLVSADVIVNLACYYDHDDDTVDTTAVVFSGSTTDVTRYIKVFTPTGGTESINNQRHNGIYTSESGGVQAYRLETNSLQVIYFTLDGMLVYNVKLIGLQIYQTSTAAATAWGIHMKQAGPLTNSCEVGYCIIRMAPTLNDSIRRGIEVGSSGGPTSAVKIYNSIIYGAGDNGGSATLHVGILMADPHFTTFVYNCIVYDWYTGIHAAVGPITAKNVAVFGNVDDFINVTPTYCAIDDADSFTGKQTLDSTSNYANEFTDVANGDFSIVCAGSVCSETGIDDPGSGLYSDDIIGFTRTSTWDIGAFELDGGNCPRTRRILILGIFHMLF